MQVRRALVYCVIGSALGILALVPPWASFHVYGGSTAGQWQVGTTGVGLFDLPRWQEELEEDTPGPSGHPESLASAYSGGIAYIVGVVMSLVLLAGRVAGLGSLIRSVGALLMGGGIIVSSFALLATGESTSFGGSLVGWGFSPSAGAALGFLAAFVVGGAAINFWVESTPGDEEEENAPTT